MLMAACYIETTSTFLVTLLSSSKSVFRFYLQLPWVLFLISYAMSLQLSLPQFLWLTASQSNSFSCIY